MAVTPEEVNRALTEILADAEAVSTLQTLAEGQGITVPFTELGRDQQLVLVKQLFSMAQTTSARTTAADLSAGSTEIPDEMVEQIFADPRADAILRNIMDSNALAGDPIDLPLDIKRSIVKYMVEQGMVSFGQR